jgi:hypothetical protein
VLTSEGLAEDLRQRGLRRAGQFSWTDAARTLRDAYSRLLSTGPSNARRR